jgi:myo-inositol 2-dehydrogenase/D-chiro-inositol 1-dehydrogenase
MTPPKLKVAAAGLGRMGKRHALNFLNRTPRAELVAAFTPDPAELQWAKLNLEPYGVTLYDDYEKMIHQPGLQAVVIGTATSVHAEEAIQAMEKNLHVLCEKPLSTNIEVVSIAYWALPKDSVNLRLTIADSQSVLISANLLSMQQRGDHTSK